MSLQVDAIFYDKHRIHIQLFLYSLWLLYCDIRQFTDSIDSMWSKLIRIVGPQSIMMNLLASFAIVRLYSIQCHEIEVRAFNGTLWKEACTLTLNLIHSTHGRLENNNSLNCEGSEITKCHRWMGKQVWRSIHFLAIAKNLFCWNVFHECFATCYNLSVLFDVSSSKFFFNVHYLFSEPLLYH